MPKRAAGLSARTVQTIKSPGLFADGGGLYLQVTKTGAKTWIFRYQIAGRRRDMGLGPVAVVSLAEAREKALSARKLVLAGTDPLEAKRAGVAAESAAAAKLVTFRTVADGYIESMRPGWKNEKHAAQWESTLATYVHPVIGDLAVGDIDAPLVLKILEPIWHKKTETATRVRGRIEAILDYAKVRGHRIGENPARWQGHLALSLPQAGKIAPVEHHTSLAYAEAPAFWKRLQTLDSTSAAALAFAILTAARTGEVLGARWEEIDLEARTWIIPGDRMKAGAEHRVPLSEPAIEILGRIVSLRTGDLVFPGQRKGKPLSNMSLTMVLRRLKVNATAHGFRSTFRTWAAEKTSVQHEVCEAALAHTIESKVVAAYQRGDMFEKRRRLMAVWAEFLAGKPK